MDTQISVLKELVYNQGLNTILSRMKVLLDSSTLRKLCNPLIVEATITDLDKVHEKIKKTWHGFNIKDVEVNLKAQTLNFKIWGTCWVPSKYRSYVVFDDAWSEDKTEMCDFLNSIKEEYAEKKSLPLLAFEGNGIEIKTI